MHPHAATITWFYEAFQRRDAATMGSCYRDDATFTDPVFGTLDAAGARAMWRMLCGRADDLAITFDGVEADDAGGRAHWQARYTWKETGRLVQNDIQARFRFVDGGIAEHVDTFDLWRWTGMALGLPGTLLGWTPLIQGPVRSGAARALARFREREG